MFLPSLLAEKIEYSLGTELPNKRIRGWGITTGSVLVKENCKDGARHKIKLLYLPVLTFDLISWSAIVNNASHFLEYSTLLMKLNFFRGGEDSFLNLFKSKEMEFKRNSVWNLFRRENLKVPFFKAVFNQGFTCIVKYTHLCRNFELLINKFYATTAKKKLEGQWNRNLDFQSYLITVLNLWLLILLRYTLPSPPQKKSFWKI